MQPTGYAIVTGGGSGIGRAFCLALAERGWAVAVVDRDGESASAVVGEIDCLGGVASSHPFDVSDSQAWEQFTLLRKQSWPRLDLLVNCAGNLLSGAIDQCESDDLRRIIEVNLLGAMYGCRAMALWLQEGGTQERLPSPRGVINIASIFAVVSPPEFAAYNASKAGLVALTETLRSEWAPHGLVATVVLPGVTPTRLFERATFREEEHKVLCEKFVERSAITPEMVANSALTAAERGRLFAVVGRRSKLYWWLKRLAPQGLIDLVRRTAARERRARS